MIWPMRIFKIFQWIVLGVLLVMSTQAIASDSVDSGKDSVSESAKPKHLSRHLNFSKKVKKTKTLNKGPVKSSDKNVTDAVFDGSTINGKYLSAGDAISTVEREKQLNELIGVRKNFNDRLSAQLSNQVSEKRKSETGDVP